MMPRIAAAVAVRRWDRLGAGGVARQKLVHARSELKPPQSLVNAVREAVPEVVARHLAEFADWGWAGHLFLLACRVPGYEGHGGAIASADKREAERVAIVEQFVAHGAPPTIRNNRKVTPLHMGCRFDLAGVARRLVELGAEVDAYDEARETPLFRAVNLGYVECAKVLIDGGANLDFQNRKGATPLHRAAQRGKRRIVPLLLEGGADPNIADRAGKTPIDYARNVDIRRALEGAG